ncbi:hypothetical protein SGRIM119S_03484 [Streptomyces griseorubiginosus]
MERAHRTGGGALEVVRLDPVAGSSHGHRRRERDPLPRRGRLGVEEAELPVDREQESFAVGPAGRGGQDVSVHGDGCAVHDEGAGGGGRGRGAQVRQPAARCDGRGHELGAGVVGVLHGDRSGAVGGDRGDGVGTQTARRGDGRAHEQHALAVGGPGGVEVLPAARRTRILPAGEPGQCAGAHVDDPDPVGAAGHGVAAALGGERDPGAVRGPGGPSVVPGAVGELPQVAAVGPQRPEVEAAAAVGADDEAAAVRRELRTGGFQSGRGERDGGATGPRQRPEDVLDLGDEPVTGRGEGRGTAGGGGQGEADRPGGGGGRGGCAGGRHGGGGGRDAGRLEEGAAGERAGAGRAGSAVDVQGSLQCAGEVPDLRDLPREDGPCARTPGPGAVLRPRTPTPQLTGRHAPGPCRAAELPDGSGDLGAAPTAVAVATVPAVWSARSCDRGRCRSGRSPARLRQTRAA